MPSSQVTTFYSYKGGSGRSMALANVAWALATNNERVLVIDWDLEAPGLHRYFHPFLSDPDQKESPGLIDRVWHYVDQLDGASGDRKDRFRSADCGDIVQPLDIPGLSKGCLHFIGAGQQNEHYSEKVVGLDWNGFYLKFDGEAFINRMIEWARGSYSHILIDSRTGVADTAGICTTQIPDLLVMCLVYNRQSIDGTASVAQSIVEARNRRGSERLKTEFIPCRVEDRSSVESARRYATNRLNKISRDDRRPLERELRRAEIRHYPWCAFEEKLAVFEELPDDKGSLLEAMHDLASRVAHEGKKLKVKSYERDVLESYWRRVAFDDPRLLDLKSLIQAPRDDAWRSLYLWLREASNEPDTRADWQMALAETTIDYLSRDDERISPNEKTFAGRIAEGIATSAWHSDEELYGARLAQVLHKRAGQHQAAGRLDEARQAIGRSLRLLDTDHSPTLRWRFARALERNGDICAGMGEHVEALRSYRDAGSIYHSLGRRMLPLGSELDLPRVQRLIAGQFMTLGDHGAANEAIREACQSILRSPEAAIERNAAEALKIFKARLRIASEVEGEEFSRTVIWVSNAGRKILPPTAMEELEVELAQVRAAKLVEFQKWDEALAALDEISPELRWNPDIVASRTEVLLAAERRDEATGFLWEAVGQQGTNLSPRLIDVAGQALSNGSGGKDFIDFLFSGVKVGGLAEGGALTNVMRNLLTHGGSGSIEKDRSKLLHLLEHVSRQDD